MNSGENNRKVILDDRTFKRDRKRWTREDFCLLLSECRKGSGLYELSNKLQRTPSALLIQMELLGIVPSENDNIGYHDIPDDDIINYIIIDKVLRILRVYLSKQFSIKSTELYSDLMIDELIDKRPKDMNELKFVTGFCDDKIHLIGTYVLDAVTNPDYMLNELSKKPPII
jgi:hypothetical protein